MESRILEFAGILRRHGVRVSTAETIDALRAVDTTGLGDRSTFRSSLRAAMVKRTSDLETYERLFTAFFSGLGDMIEEAGLAARGDMTDAELQEFLDALQRLIDGQDVDISELARALALQDSGALEQMLRSLMDSERMQSLAGDAPANAAREAVEALGAQNLAREFEQLSQAAEDAGMSPEALERLKEYLAQRAKELGEIIKGLLRLRREQEAKPEEQAKEFDKLLDKSFYYLSPAEIKKMREAVSALARRMKNVMAVRRKRMKRGRLDVKGTLRSSMEFGGVPFRVRYDNKRRERPQIVILCDISDSVRNVSRFMLQFVHSLQDLYSRVRSYVFVADIAEVSRLFKENDIQTAIQSAINGDVVNVYAHSDFGRAFKNFHRDHLDVIDSRTTVIILGDARNNYNVPNDWAVRDISERAKQVIWLNPENASTWGFGDSEMAAYAKHCKLVEECRNLRQLYKVVDHLVVG